MSSSVKFDFHLDEVLIRQTTTMSYESMDTIIETNRRTMGQIHTQLTLLQGKVERLEEEREELKEQAEDSFQAIADALCGEGDEADSIAGWGHGDKIVKRIKDLKEENKRLDETLDDTLASLNFFQEQCSELKNERKELKHKMEELKGDSEKLDDALIRAAVATKTYDDFVGDLKVIDEENKELKEKLDGVKDILQTETLASGIQNRFYEILNDEEDDESDDEE
jgi:chromosome segregation ATPase